MRLFEAKKKFKRLLKNDLFKKTTFKIFFEFCELSIINTKMNVINRDE